MSSDTRDLPPPGKYDHVDPSDPRALWPYDPSFGAAIFFSVAFGLSFVGHIAQACIFKKKFCWVIIMSAAWQTTALILRAFSTRHQLSYGFFIPSQLLTLLAPIWTNAFCYMVLGRMIHFFIPEHKIAGVSSRRLTLLFVLLDIASFIIQGTGGSMASNTDNDPESSRIAKLGLDIYMGGLGAQQTFILLFLVVAYLFQRKMPTVWDPRPYPWRPLLYILYGVLALITIRIIYRLVEFSGGLNGYIPMHEWPYYLFDATPMLLCSILFHIWHPGRTLIGPGSEFESNPKKSKKNKNRADGSATESNDPLEKGFNGDGTTDS